jgi:hypothetical protein
VFYFLLEGSFHFNPLSSAAKKFKWRYTKASSKRETTEAAGMSQTRQNKIVNALLQMKWTLLQHRNERESHQSSDIQKKETMGTQIATSYHTSPFSQTPMRIDMRIVSERHQSSTERG